MLAGVAGEVERGRAAVHAQLAGHSVAIGLCEDAAVRTRDLGGSVHGEVQHMLRLRHRHAEDLGVSDANEGAQELTSEGGLAESLRSGDHQCLAAGP
ncbi:hypothetical protein A5N70_20925 [Prescottella equi]|nr:hypothetical protein A5N70_20925 [Prescottella equi]